MRSNNNGKAVQLLYETGRTSFQLGIPTANIPPSGLSAYPELPTGVYYGWVGLLVPGSSVTTDPDPSRKDSYASLKSTTPIVPWPSADQTSSKSASSSSSRSDATTNNGDSENPAPYLLPAVLSIGYNPFYANKTRSIEIHILQPYRFIRDFYGAALNLLVLGYIRPEYDYESLEKLVEDIRIDCEVAGRSLSRPPYKAYLPCASQSALEGQEAGYGAWLQSFDWVKRDAETGEILYDDDGDGTVKGAKIQV